jgi:hypothetical protein
MVASGHTRGFSKPQVDDVCAWSQRCSRYLWLCVQSSVFPAPQLPATWYCRSNVSRMVLFLLCVMQSFLVTLQMSSIKNFNILQVTDTWDESRSFSETAISYSVCLSEFCPNYITEQWKGIFFTSFAVCEAFLCVLLFPHDGRAALRNYNGGLTLEMKLALLMLILMEYSLSLTNLCRCGFFFFGGGVYGLVIFVHWVVV